MKKIIEIYGNTICAIFVMGVILLLYTNLGTTLRDLSKRSCDWNRDAVITGDAFYHYKNTEIKQICVADQKEFVIQEKQAFDDYVWIEDKSGNRSFLYIEKIIRQTEGCEEVCPGAFIKENNKGYLQFELPGCYSIYVRGREKQDRDIRGKITLFVNPRREYI